MDEPPTQASALRVLIVDDNQDAANSLELLLQLAGHETLALYTAQPALEQAAAFSPDLALLDIGLPDMDGYELASRMRALCPRTRLVAISGYGKAEDEQRAAEAGFDEHLVKPVDFARLATLCAQFVQCHQGLRLD
jgi:two-component system CheB/CheR fusion protein